MERIDGLYFAEGEDGQWHTFDIAAKEKDRETCEGAVRESIGDVILNSVKLQRILSQIGKVKINSSLCALISSMLYYDSEKEHDFVQKQIARLDRYCIDGIIDFRLRELVEEWKELGNIISSTLEKGYGEKEIYSLAVYMLGERKNTSLFIADSKEIFPEAE